MTDFPRFQWSKMSPDRSEQVVVRGNDDRSDNRDLVLDIEFAKGLLPKKDFTEEGPTTQELQEEMKTKEAEIESPSPKVVPLCSAHNIPMKWKPAGVSLTTGKPYTGFWTCSNKNEDGSWCRAKPK